MNTDLQPKKSSSPKKRSSKTQSTTSELIMQNAWWPFDRVDGKILQKLHKQHTSEDLGEALL